MADIGPALARNRDALNELIAAAEAAGATWTVARAPGKWSPSQVVEHVARSIEESAKDVDGLPSKFPNLPWFLKPVARSLLFNRVIRNGRFPKARTSKPFDPVDGPATTRDARARLEGAVSQYERACRARAEGGDVVRTCIFGTVPLQDYLRFNEVHVRHHRNQISVARSSSAGQ